jgi:hypothetical protein
MTEYFVPYVRGNVLSWGEIGQHKAFCICSLSWCSDSNRSSGLPRTVCDIYDIRHINGERMKKVASSTDHDERENALSELDNAMAFMPWNIDRDMRAMELCVEAAAVAGAFEAIA